MSSTFLKIGKNSSFFNQQTLKHYLYGIRDQTRNYEYIFFEKSVAEGFGLYLFKHFFIKHTYF